jgi:hypothetical protein
MKWAYLLLRYYTLVVALYGLPDGILVHVYSSPMFTDSPNLAGLACAKGSNFASLLIA